MFLDRDGVLNRPVVRDGRPHPPTSVEQLELYPEVPAACHRLRGLGFALSSSPISPTWPGAQLDAEVVDAINGRLRDEIELDGVYICPHDDADHCACRKPAPGLLLSAAFDLGLDLSHSVDGGRPVAGHRGGPAAPVVETVHIDRGYDERAPVEDADSVAIDLQKRHGGFEHVAVGEGGGAAGDD